ncbi:hypothetical protein [Pontibacillus yanchengensis]|uniref:Uncharacterized protein n=1 Tax=Pontibacillus yanchengensis Y32 TaxID=1385514 RepID=A0A0A2T6Z8_9BACI|nr:hypothetical protein [Pontibacillus yanchengensis]KGP71274.1 hypothetical protein N782_20285 [Pontibacillus yanchengensis Y32]
MKNGIYFIFGKPYTESKFFHFSYWFGVGFYFLAIVLSAVPSVLYGEWLSLLFTALFFPVLFRIVYNINTRIHKSFKGMNKKVIILLSVLFGLITIVIVTTSFFFADNVAINLNKTTTNGDVKLSIGSLQGSHTVETYEITQEGTVTIPYEASVGKGKFFMSVEQSDTTIWEDQITGSKTGVIEFQGEKDSYYISIRTEEAKKIKLNLSLY